MRLVYKFYIRHTDEIDKLFRTSNNLYNQALYLFRQRLDADGVWTWYKDMDKLMKGVTNLEGECNYKLLKSKYSQQILRVLDKNIKSYCKSITDWNAQYGKNTGTTRAASCKMANIASCKSKQESARKNENNARFHTFVMTLENMYGKARTAGDVQMFCDELNRNGIRTATGMEYDVSRFRAMYQKCNKLFK